MSQCAPGAQPSPSLSRVSDSGTKRGRSSRSRAWPRAVSPRPAKPRAPWPLPAGLGLVQSRQCPEPQMPHWNEAWDVRSLEERDLGVLPGPQRAVTPVAVRRARRGWVLMTAKSPHPADICKRPPPKPPEAPAKSKSPHSPEACYVHRRCMQNRRTRGDIKQNVGPFPGVQTSGPARGVTRCGLSPPTTEPGSCGYCRPAEHGGVSCMQKVQCLQVGRRELFSSF